MKPPETEVESGEGIKKAPAGVEPAYNGFAIRRELMSDIGDAVQFHIHYIRIAVMFQDHCRTIT